jgi:hypothetical protein
MPGFTYPYIPEGVQTTFIPLMVPFPVTTPGPTVVEKKTRRGSCRRHIYGRRDGMDLAFIVYQTTVLLPLL